MTPRTATTIDSLATPQRDGEILIWPEAASLTQLAEKNQRHRRSCSLTILDRPLGEWMGQSLADPPIVMVGHQPSFFHPGVLAKNFVAGALAARSGGKAQYLVVDSDASRGVTISWPELDQGLCRAASASAVPRHAAAYEQLPVKSAGQWRSFFDQVIADGPLKSNSLALFVEPFVAAPDQPGDYTTRWIAAASSVEQAVGAGELSYRRVSHLFSFQGGGDSTCAAAFVGHVLLDAPRFARAYNDALSNYRLARGILGVQHPVPDLKHAGDRVELPFWVMSGLAPRRRLWATVGSDRVELFAEEESIGATGCAELRRDPVAALCKMLGPWRIRPRALALTLFARIFLCDLFIHGIGGAKYDQITDEIARAFFQVDLPPYACASATLRLPLHAYDCHDNDKLDPERRLRDIRFNPQRYLDGPNMMTLKAQREQAIALASRLREDSPREHRARRDAYARIQSANAAYLANSPARVAGLQREWQSHRQHRLHNLAALSREWFFGLYSKEALTSLAANVNELVNGDGSEPQK
jgi:hypothetical protein